MPFTQPGKSGAGFGNLYCAEQGSGYTKSFFAEHSEDGPPGGFGSVADFPCVFLVELGNFCGGRRLVQGAASRFGAQFLSSDVGVDSFLAYRTPGPGGRGEGEGALATQHHVFAG